MLYSGSCFASSLRVCLGVLMKLSLALGFTLSSAQAAQPFPITDIMKGPALGLFMDTFTDPQGTLTLDDIIHLDESGRFLPSEEEIPNYGLAPSVQWTKFTLRNASDKVVSVILENNFTFVDRFTLFYRSEDGVWVSHEAGDQLPFSSRDIRTRQAAFPIQLAPGDHLFYARSEAVGGHQLPLLIWSRDDFFEHNALEYGAIGILVGIHIVICLYNLFLFISLRDRTYLVYVTYVLCNLLYQSLGLGLAQQLLHSLSLRETISNQEMILCVDLVSISALYFSYLFLNIRKRLRSFTWVFVAIATLDALNILINLLYSVRMATTICIMTASLTTCALIVSGFLIARQGYRPAFFYLIAWSWYLIGVAATCSNLIGIFPTNVYTRWGQFSGGALEIVALSLALGARINDKRRRQVLKINELNQALESKVAELMSETSCRKSMAAKAAHHLNNPIQAIAGLAENTIREEKLIWKQLESMFPDDAERTADGNDVIASLRRSFQSLEQNSAMTLKAVKRASIISNELRIMSGIHGIDVQRVTIGEFWNSLAQDIKEDDILGHRPIALSKLPLHVASHESYIEPISFSKSIFYILKEAFETVPPDMDIHLTAQLDASAAGQAHLQVKATAATGIKHDPVSEWREVTFCKHLLYRFGSSIQLQSSRDTVLLEIGLPQTNLSFQGAA